MREIIQRHNRRLNGLLFSTIEFGLIGLFAGVFATYYLTHHGVGMAFISWEISLNCVPVVIYGIREIRSSRASCKRLGSYWDSKAREMYRRENPHMLRDKVILTVATLLPFVNLATVLFECSNPPSYETDGRSAKPKPTSDTHKIRVSGRHHCIGVRVDAKSTKDET